MLKLIPVNVEYIRNIASKVFTLNFCNPMLITKTRARGENMVIHPKVVKPPLTGDIIQVFMLSVENHTAANPDMISAVNIKEKTLAT